MLKTCLQCGKEFKTYNSKVVRCSKACANAAMVKAKTYTCTNCGKDFQRPNYVIKKDVEKHFCTQACHMQWVKANARVATCLTCSKEFKPGSTTINYCSKACRDRAQYRKVEMICEQCHKPFLAFPSKYMEGRKYCSHKCSEEYHAGNNHPNYRGGTWLMHGTRWDKVRKKILERDKACRLCGATSNKNGRALHVHHIHGRRNYLIVDIAHEESNLVTLCAPCHCHVEQCITHGRTSQLPKWLRPPK